MTAPPTLDALCARWALDPAAALALARLADRIQGLAQQAAALPHPPRALGDARHEFHALAGALGLGCSFPGGRRHRPILIRGAESFPTPEPPRTP